MKASTPTLDEIRGWPATVGIPEAARAIGVSKSHLYELVKRGEAPVTVLSFGTRHRVVTASLLRLLQGT
ncbi:helix-turn-helix domain-containing protein [Streptomyces sp. S3(2020)]|uniref:helix-turn-helix transcriptional regulator n=1 Tax=Streptomyces sp. S3(2020) TaxID=2732044 RepID=UPI0014884AA0|nr:helix-turn-helix domain-containing protein [Streptomyces sp. S3(2020)]NNN36123.1 helix-turn-helix domain-containing protein [Streptomyces sp. S3(2020)]